MDSNVNNTGLTPLRGCPRKRRTVLCGPTNCTNRHEWILLGAGLAFVWIGVIRGPTLHLLSSIRIRWCPGLVGCSHENGRPVCEGPLIARIDTNGSFWGPGLAFVWIGVIRGPTLQPLSSIRVRWCLGLVGGSHTWEVGIFLRVVRVKRL